MSLCSRQARSLARPTTVLLLSSSTNSSVKAGLSMRQSNPEKSGFFRSKDSFKRKKAGLISPLSFAASAGRNTTTSSATRKERVSGRIPSDSRPKKRILRPATLCLPGRIMIGAPTTYLRSGKTRKAVLDRPGKNGFLAPSGLSPTAPFVLREPPAP
ncbi:MAG: hypothetical protein BWY42_01719 [Candidatus Omnitrophica bacterium ADurb.Bin277]|nr:MAG: hypothetical protein BWY42_01719 [Candidatus Omnitrophica bacterium ADurb.Bin277]